MATQSMAKKMQLKSGQRVLALNAPQFFAKSLAGSGVEIAQAPSGQFDALCLFAVDSHELAQMLDRGLPVLKVGGLLWLAYPKKSSGITTDLARDEGWSSITALGWRPVRQIAVDETWSALRFVADERLSGDDAIAQQYSGAKAHLRPIFDRLVEIAQMFGADVTLAPRKSYVALVRQHQFAVIAPSTRTRVDLGLKFVDAPDSPRLTEARNLGSGSITHKVALTAVSEIDEEIMGWLNAAYAEVA